MVTNLFVRKKKIRGREYYYVVKSTRAGDRWKKIERYIGINPPSKKDLEEYDKEFDSAKEFINSKKDILEKIRKEYNDKIKKATKDELDNIEEEVMIKFTYDTSRIEGSSLSYKDTRMLLQEGITPAGKPVRDIKETGNHKEAYVFMKNNLRRDVDEKLILEFHSMLKKDVTEDAGKFRDAGVRVGDLIPVKAGMVESELNNLLSWYKKNKKLHPLELGAVFHSVFERIHPFFDGNGRIGRLLLNFILLKNRYPVIIVQNKNKRRYYNSLRRADDGNYLYMIKCLFSELVKGKYWQVYL